MRRPCCHTFLAFVLKVLIFLQTFIGFSIILYSVYMLNQWNHHHSVHVPPTPPSADSNLDARVSDHVIAPLNLASDAVPLFDHGIGLNSLELPAPWFIYAFMGLGIVLCCVTCTGYIAAEAINGCCLCFYTLLKVVLILLEAFLVAFIALDQQWEKDIPPDPTGELDSLRAFIEDNVELCRWVGITVLIIQALSLLIAMILRAMVSTQTVDHDIEGHYDVQRGRSWEPLLNPQVNQTSGSNKGAHSDIWSSRMREKYGLNSDDAKHNLLNQSTSVNARAE
ncbi:tetraspanin-18-like [Diospyros lotus]|uniref:tetraspanin-18-like n=1 Tax=Diospyros lotus TaxID=55363 RepID=UPI00224EF574|nr:tetraspanin-18-like [Diospyros lotus]